MATHLAPSPRPDAATSPDGGDGEEARFGDPAAAPRGVVQRFAGWADGTPGPVGTAGAVTRAVVCVLLCLVAALATVGALTGIVAGLGWLASLL